MKCKYCHSEIEQDALFCPNCGKDLSKISRCVKCGELLDEGTSFCPYCGVEQPHEENVEVKRKGFINWLLLLLFIVLLVGAGAWFFFSDGFSFGGRSKTAVVDSDSITVSGERSVENAKEFIEKMYKDFFENKNFDTENISNLKKYLSPSVAEKLKMESPYDGDEGEFSYVVDFFRDGSFSYERPDYGDKVVSRTIKPMSDDWFMVTNVWDVIKEPVKVYLQVKSINGTYNVVDVCVVTAKEFIEKMYKDFYDPYNHERTEKKLLSKYFTEEAMQKFYVESDYDEGDFFYCTDFLVNGSISGDASPDYGDKVVSRTIEPKENDWFLVKNIWDVIKEPVKVYLQVKFDNGVYKIVDIRENK